MTTKTEPTPEQKTVEEISSTISKLAKAVADLLKGPLNRKALVTLLSYSCGESRKTVEDVLTALETMDKEWLAQPNLRK